MGSIGGMLGLSGGASGTGFSGPQGADITNGTTADQISTAYGGAQNSLQSQQALLDALQKQNGIGNQSQVYGQLQGIANGTGPNPAQAMLNQATGQNVNNQAALMAGQRGAGANVGLMARQAAQQGAGIQQNAVGQGATMQAQQALGAIGQAGQMATQQAGQQIGATTANTQAQQSEQQILQKALADQNTAKVQNQAAINAANASMTNTGMQGQQAVIGGVMGGGGAALGLAKGGTVPQAAPAAAPAASPITNGFTSGWAGSSGGGGPQSSMGQFLGQQTQSSQGLNSGMASLVSGIANKMKGPSNAIDLNDENAVNTAIGGSAPSYLDSQMGGSGNMASNMAPIGAAPMMEAHGGNVGSRLKGGGHVPGTAKVAGNSYANDTVDAKLSPGEGVIDRETMNDKGPLGQQARLLMSIVKAKKRGK